LRLRWLHGRGLSLRHFYHDIERVGRERACERSVHFLPLRRFSEIPVTSLLLHLRRRYFT
jgi:hypothetical protein